MRSILESVLKENNLIYFKANPHVMNYLKQLGLQCHQIAENKALRHAQRFLFEEQRVEKEMFNAKHRGSEGGREISQTAYAKIIGNLHVLFCTIIQISPLLALFTGC